MQRAYDMIIHDIALQNLPVRMCMDRAGLSGDDGPTHHGLFDIGYLRHVPNLVFMAPRNEEMFADMLWTMNEYNDGPTAIRYPRGEGTGARPKEKPQTIPIGKAEVIHDGEDVALFGLGGLFPMAEQTRTILEADGISTALIDPRFIKPLDKAVIEAFAKKVRVIATFEDHVLANGFGASVIETLHDLGYNIPVVRIGWPDEFIEHGKVDWLRAKHGLTVESAVRKIRVHLEENVLVSDAKA
jgi:1-deoxy-D-xylulose-5-phosphate synthase